MSYLSSLSERDRQSAIYIRMKELNGDQLLVGFIAWFVLWTVYYLIFDAVVGSMGQDGFTFLFCGQLVVPLINLAIIAFLFKSSERWLAFGFTAAWGLNSIAWAIRGTNWLFLVAPPPIILKAFWGGIG